ncbi:MAG TPA: acyltransferase family protein [Streptosporangiaceae bacterium]|nr:acyltransferase family protein [Streptosporangiaceae bacterium]
MPVTADQRPPASQPGAKSRLAVLDGLRLLAATMVVFYHYIGVPNAKIGHQGRSEALAWGTSAANIFPHFLHQAATFGWTGVELFFMISGFVICMSGWGRRPADFFVSRVVRLVPAYWTATLLTAAVLMTFPKLTSGIQPSMVLTNFTMVQSAYGVPNLVPAYWTLFVELTFYLLFGLVAIGGVTYRRMVTFCVLWSVASIPAANSHNPVLNMIINPPYSPFFIAGIAFFLIYKFGSNLLLWAIVAYSWLIAVNQPHTSPPPQVVILISAFFVVMGVVSTHRLDRVSWRWLTVGGALTYPLYLVHQDIGFTVFAYLRDSVPPLVLAVVTYVMMLAIAWLIHRGVERPLAPVLKARLSEAVSRVRLSGPRPAPAQASPAMAGGPAFESGQPSGAAANGHGPNGHPSNGQVPGGPAANGAPASGAAVNGAAASGPGASGPRGSRPANGPGGNGSGGSGSNGGARAGEPARNGAAHGGAPGSGHGGRASGGRPGPRVGAGHAGAAHGASGRPGAVPTGVGANGSPGRGRD